MKNEDQPIPGQLDVYEVLSDVERNGLGVDQSAKKLTVAQIVARKMKGKTDGNKRR
jgi:hypothetical protein